MPHKLSNHHMVHGQYIAQNSSVNVTTDITGQNVALQYTSNIFSSWNFSPFPQWTSPYKYKEQSFESLSSWKILSSDYDLDMQS